MLGDGESAGADRVLDAAGHAAAMYLHYGHEHGGVEQLLGEEGARRWLAGYADVPEGRRHLAMHRGHLVHVNDHDRPAVDAALVTRLGLARTPAQWREQLAAMEAAGATEVAFQPAGADIPRELEAFTTAARG